MAVLDGVGVVVVRECDFLWCGERARWLLTRGEREHFVCSSDLEELLWGFAGLPVYVELLPAGGV
jgi:hypothetical protein